MYETILFERDGGVATVALNRPKVLNAFNGRMHEEIHDALDSAAADEEVRCVVVRGEGRGFSAGADLKSEDLSREDGEAPDLGEYLLISAERSKAMDNGLYGEDAIEPGHRLARRSPSQGLGTQAAGLESKGDSTGFGRHRRGGEPVDEAGTRRRRGRSSQEEDLSRCAATLERRAAGAPQRAVGPRSPRPWIPG